jgi:hypothetical protein
VQEVGQRPARHHLGQPVVLVQPDHDGLRVALAGQPDQGVGDGRVIGHRLAAGGQACLPGQRGTALGELLR